MLGILRIPEILLETHVRADISARKCPASREYHVEIHASFPPSVIPRAWIFDEAYKAISRS